MRKVALAITLIVASALACHGQNIFLPAGGTNVWTGTDAFRLGIDAGPTTFSNLSSFSVSGMSMARCTDCQQTNPCAGGGSGAYALYINGAWSCTAGSSFPPALTLETNSTLNGSQSLLNLTAGSNITLSNTGGVTTITSTGGGGCGSGNCVITNPTASQNIIQPPGTQFSASTISNIQYADPVLFN